MSTKNNAQAAVPASQPVRLLILLVLATLLIILLRIFAFSSDMASGDRLWQLSIDASFDARDNETLINISTPFITPYSELVQQSISHPGLKLRHNRTGEEPKRGITALASKDGRAYLAVEFMIHQSSTPALLAVKPPISTKLRELYLQDEDGLDSTHPALLSLANRLSEISDDREDQLVEIYKFCRNLKLEKQKRQRSVAQVITDKKALLEERVLVFVALARAMQIPARMVTGFILHESLEVKPHYWAQAYIDGAWVPYDPFYGYRKELPENFVPFAYNSRNIVNMVNGDRLKVEYFIEENFSAISGDKQRQRQWVNILDLTRLNLDIRTTLSSLLLLPLGVLITAVFRHFIGIHSYGVFTPTLLALAVTHNQWQTGLAILAVIVFFSVIGRKAFPKQLSRTPRLAVIFTFVAISIAMGVSMLDYYMPSPDGYAVLLPIVILTSLIDRFYKTVDGMGISVAYIRLFWTIVITITCLPVVQFKALGYFLVEYPELHLLTLAAVVFVSHYQGKKLSQFIPASLKENNRAATAKNRSERDDEI